MVGQCSHVVMVIDDDRDVSGAIVEALQDAAYTTIAASNGRDALDKLRALPEMPCVLLLDLMMPEMDGWSFRKAQLDDPSLRSIPVVVLTAHGGPNDPPVNGIQHADMLRKPVGLQTLLEKVEEYCGKVDG
jgi:CheY-like chemotaxis protein